MDTSKLLAEGRSIWPEHMLPPHIALAMGVVYGDICRALRDAQEGAPLDPVELQKELGNMIFSTIRWCDDLGYKPEECIEASIKAQQTYQLRHHENSDWRNQG